MGCEAAYIDLRLKIFEEMIMAEVRNAKEEIAQVKASQEAMQARILAFVKSMQDQIDALRGTALDDADFGTLDEMQADLNAFNPANPATLPEGEMPPAPLP